MARVQWCTCITDTVAVLGGLLLSKSRMQGLHIPVWLWSVCQADEPIPSCYRRVFAAKSQVPAGLAQVMYTATIKDPMRQPNVYDAAHTGSAC